VNRPTTGTGYAQFKFNDAGSNDWAMGLRDGDYNIHIYNVGLAHDEMIFNLATGAIILNYGITTPLLATATNCAAAGSAANPSLVACSAAPSGAFSCSVSASTGTCSVASTAVTANSRIFVQPSVSEGANLSVTCNTSSDVGLTGPRLLSKTAATGFIINLGTFATNPVCFDFWVVN
jgi:hypothetical protein